ncbi:hypothetical protein EVG20_g9560 [Dentipellis fragilis]|uniref:BTB domain-containing protein n=1 Tax=Dentipellis fragilis TaxID=205917 RepID=A0A4Y9XZA4_9AGAM|nr:hypothetical protein EVG20_g9560 [Dentipellis fragilis]
MLFLTNDSTMDGDTIKHHKNLYFDDGNVALVATTRGTGGEPDEHLVFRLHQSILAKHSPVFKDMFGFPAAPGAELYEGVPLVRMTDSASDLESLLGVFYCEPVFSLKAFDPNTPLRVKSLLILADKYDVQHLRELIVNRLEDDWPQSLFEWDSLEAEVSSKVEACTLHDISATDVDDDYPEPGSAIQLARQCNIPNILPAAFYHLSRISIDFDWDHLRTAEGSAPEAWYTGGSRSARWNCLSKEDFICLLQGRARLAEYVEDTLCLQSAYPKAHAGGDCSEADWSTFWHQFRKECKQDLDILAVLRLYSELFNDVTAWKGLCISCRAKISSQATTARQEIWRQIPTFFKLEHS